MGASQSNQHYTSEELLLSLEQGRHDIFVNAVSDNRRIAKRPLRARNGDTGIHVLATKGSVEGLRGVLEQVLRLYAAEKGSPLTPEERTKFSSKLFNQQNDRGRTPLMTAAKGGHEAVVTFLIDQHATVWYRDRCSGCTVMHYAAAAGHDSVVRLLMQHCRDHPPPPSVHAPPSGLLDMPNNNGLTPLHYAVWHKRHRMVTLLCELGASLYAATTWLTTSDTVHLSVQVPCAAGSTPLHVAAACGSGRCTKAIMKAYAARVSDPDFVSINGEELTDPRLVQDRQGNLAFAVAMQAQHVRLLHYLHPFTPLSEMFADERPEDRVVGVPKLTELAAMAAQKVLIAQLSSLEETLADYKAKKQKTPDSKATKEDIQQQNSAHSHKDHLDQGNYSSCGSSAKNDARAITSGKRCGQCVDVSATANVDVDASLPGLQRDTAPMEARIQSTNSNNGSSTQDNRENDNQSDFEGLPLRSSSTPPAAAEVSTPGVQASSSAFAKSDTSQLMKDLEACATHRRKPSTRRSRSKSLDLFSSAMDDELMYPPSLASSGLKADSSAAVVGLSSTSWAQSPQICSQPSAHTTDSATLLSVSMSSGGAAGLSATPIAASVANNTNEQLARFLSGGGVAGKAAALLSEAAPAARADHWMARRSVWRQTMQRHRRQLLAAADSAPSNNRRSFQFDTPHTSGHNQAQSSSTSMGGELLGDGLKRANVSPCQQPTRFAACAAASSPGAAQAETAQQGTHVRIHAPETADPEVSISSNNDFGNDASSQHNSSYRHQSTSELEPVPGASPTSAGHVDSPVRSLSGVEDSDASVSFQNSPLVGALATQVQTTTSQPDRPAGDSSRSESNHNVNTSNTANDAGRRKHIPPAVAFSLRLLGQGSAFGRGGDLSAPKFMTRLSRRIRSKSGRDLDILDSLGHRASPHHEDEDAEQPSENQIKAALHMVRMHRLTNGVEPMFGTVAGVGSSSQQPGAIPEGEELLVYDTSPHPFSHNAHQVPDDVTTSARGSTSTCAQQATSITSPAVMTNSTAEGFVSQKDLMAIADGGFSRDGSVRSGTQAGSAPTYAEDRSHHNKTSGPFSAVLRSSRNSLSAVGLDSGGAGGGGSMCAGSPTAGIHSAARMSSSLTRNISFTRTSLVASMSNAGDTGQGPSTAPNEGSVSNGNAAMSVSRAGSVTVTMVRTSSAQVLNRVLTLARQGTTGTLVNDDPDDGCGVCMEPGDYVKLATCNHKVCISCAKELVRLHELKAALCPFCRGHIMGFALA